MYCDLLLIASCFLIDAVPIKASIFDNPIVRQRLDGENYI